MIWTNLLGFNFHQQISSLLNKAFFPWAKQGKLHCHEHLRSNRFLYGTIDFSIVVLQKLIRINQVFQGFTIQRFYNKESIFQFLELVVVEDVLIFQKSTTMDVKRF